jgi:hypothetical protein
MHLVIENNILEEIVVYQNKRPDASEGKKKRIRKYSLVSKIRDPLLVKERKKE